MQVRDFDNPSPDLNGKSILVTGGTGSFGNAFVAAVVKRYKPRKLIIYSRDEMKQYEMEQRFSQRQYPCLRYFIGDVRDRDRLEMAMRGVDIVIHAAALKHVPAAEYNPFECIHTNVLGAENVVNASIRAGVERVVRPVDRQGGQPDQYLRREQACLRQDLRRREQHRRRAIARVSPLSATAMWSARAAAWCRCFASCLRKAQPSCRSPTSA